MTEETRFEFGKNWQSFLKLVDEERIQVAIESLQTLLQIEDLSGKSFLDIGSGSGLFSLAARRLGATVHSFDVDEQSVACAQELQRRFSDDEFWTIEQGSILDREFTQTLSQYDIVYSWGVLHHTGQMWDAIDTASQCVANGGRLSIAIYNDQGGASRRWRFIKKLYNRSPAPIRWMLIAIVGLQHEFMAFVSRLIRCQNPLPFQDWAKRKQDRGMSIWHDVIDWVGGYPFEVAKPDQIFRFLQKRGFNLIYLTTQTNGYGCNEFTFIRGQH